MKKSLLTLVTLLGLGTITLKAQAPTPDLFHYRFTPAGTSVVNYASAPPVGTATGTIIGAQTQTGAINCMNALVGSGGSSTNDFINTGWATNLSGAFSISFWTSNIQPNTTLYYIFGDNNAGSFRCFTNGVAGANNWIIRGTGLTDLLITGAATPSANMVTAVYDPVAGSASAYINGVYTNSVAYTSATLTGVGPFKVGGYSANTGLSPGGLMADYRIYGSALTASQVAAVYAATSLTAVSLTVTGNNTVCAGQSTTLTASGANSYAWSTSATTNSIVVSPTINPTSYTVAGTAGSCSATTVYTVNINTPTIAIAGPTSICAGQPATLAASGVSTYVWNTSATTASISVTPTANISYTVTGTSAAGCTATAVTSLTVNPSPTIAITGSNSICSGQSATLLAGGASTYSWNTSATSASISVTPTANTSYTVTGTSAAGCTATAVTSLTVNPSPTIAITGPNSICSGQSATLLAGGASTYSWNTSATSASISVTPTANTSYTATGTNSLGCSATAVKSLTVNANPTISVVSSASLICTGQSATLTPSGAATYTYSSGSGVVNPTVTTTYTVSGTNANGCVGSTAFTQNVSPCTGINEIAKNGSGVSVYPNPSNGILNIELEAANENTSVIIVNALGQVMLNEKANIQHSLFNIQHFSNGVYFVKVMQGGKVVDVQKVIKN